MTNVTSTSTTATNSSGVWARMLYLLSHGSNLPRWRRFALYAGVATAVLSVIWFPVGMYLVFKPLSYTSTWALILPGSGSGHAVSLESVGQASATASSPYTSHSVDPKVNYKAVAESAPVLAAAAAHLGLTLEKFGKPRIKLVDQTALMDFRISGDTASQAQEKSLALYTAMQHELDRLRDDELSRREAASGDMLRNFSDKLRLAQQRILDYQASSQIVSMEQFTELTLNLERMRSNVLNLKAERAGLAGRLNSLQATLGTSPILAAAVIELQQDVLFRQLAEKWAQASALLTENQARWGRKHQQVVSAREDEEGLRRALLKRADAVAPELETSIERLVAQVTAESALYTRVIELFAEQQGTGEQITALEQGIHDQAQLLERSTTDASNLEDLKRKHQVATAVFTTALAKVDIGKSDRFSSYPLVQLLAEPTLPEKPDTIGRNLALLGAIAGSFFSLFGLILLWIRKPFLRKLLKNA
ncbi:MAG: exopolysaccharide biosynthesis protein [Gammaproteobacteria bacterium]